MDRHQQGPGTQPVLQRTHRRYQGLRRTPAPPPASTHQAQGWSARHAPPPVRAVCASTTLAPPHRHRSDTASAAVHDASAAEPDTAAFNPSLLVSKDGARGVQQDLPDLSWLPTPLPLYDVQVRAHVASHLATLRSLASSQSARSDALCGHMRVSAYTRVRRSSRSQRLQRHPTPARPTAHTVRSRHRRTVPLQTTQPTQTQSTSQSRSHGRQAVHYFAHLTLTNRQYTVLPRSQHRHHPSTTLPAHRQTRVLPTRKWTAMGHLPVTSLLSVPGRQ